MYDLSGLRWAGEGTSRGWKKREIPKGELEYKDKGRRRVVVPILGGKDCVRTDIQYLGVKNLWIRPAIGTHGEES